MTLLNKYAAVTYLLAQIVECYADLKYLLRLLLGFAMLLLDNEITAGNILFISEVAGFTGTPNYTLLILLARIMKIISITGTFVIIVNIIKLFRITYISDSNK